MKLQNLLEGSYLPSDVPEHFYVAIQYANNYRGSRENYINQFIEGKFRGIAGITTTLESAENFVYMSPIVFKMDGMDAVHSNKLSMVNYHNVDYLVSNNLAAYRRITETTAEELFTLIIHKFQLPARPAATQLAQKLKSAKVNSLNQLVFFLLTNFKKELHPWTPQEVKEIVFNAISMNVKNYAEETEWIVKDRVLVIPEHSEAIIYKNFFGSLFEEFVEMVKDNHLDKRYFITYTDKTP